ncbi:hypothetical protein DL765_007099 [Monosporascus sp. GIB2]|nr:hypothetical protein DL765_007099 [Monosporascus sp. GIB2]
MAPPNAGKAPTPYQAPTSFKNSKIRVETAVYAENLKNAISTTRDVSKELRDEFKPFVESAKKRVKELIDTIQALRKELKETQDMLVAANRDHLHPTLLEIADDPMTWNKGEEHKVPA